MGGRPAGAGPGWSAVLCARRRRGAVWLELVADGRSWSPTALAGIGRGRHRGGDSRGPLGGHQGGAVCSRDPPGGPTYCGGDFVKEPQEWAIGYLAARADAPWRWADDGEVITW